MERKVLALRKEGDGSMQGSATGVRVVAFSGWEAHLFSARKGPKVEGRTLTMTTMNCSRKEQQRGCSGRKVHAATRPPA